MSLNGKQLAWFSEDISSVDEKVLGHCAGDNKGQQSFFNRGIANCNASLVSSLVIQIHVPDISFRQCRCFNCVQCLQRRSRRHESGCVEYGLDAVEGLVRTSGCCSFTGVANSTADILSRRNNLNT